MERPSRSARTGSVTESTEAYRDEEIPLVDQLLSLSRPKRTGRNENPAGSGTSVPGTGTGSGGTGVDAAPGTTAATPWVKYALIAAAIWFAWSLLGKVKI